MGRDWQRDYLPRPQWQPDRLPSNDHALESTRYHHHEQAQTADMSRPISIDRALREQCRIPAQHYFVSAILDNGETVTFSGPTEFKESIPTFFDMDRWVRCATGRSPSALANIQDDQDAGANDYSLSEVHQARQGQNRGPGQGMGLGLDYGGHRALERRRAQNMVTFDEDTYRNRKRVRASNSRRETDFFDEPPVRVTQTTKMPIQISNKTEIWNIYDQRFRSLQQTACKLMAKAWVKLVEPKKQSTHPYTGSDEKAPDWWPKPWGPSREDRVRHKEPDHLYKKERVHLLKHILRMIVLPNGEQHIDIQKLHLNVAKLEEATNEALSSFFSDKDAPNNVKKRLYLKEIFLLAKNEERFRNGEIDGTTNVYVMSDDKIPDNYQSESEEMIQIKEDEEQDAAQIPSMIPPHRTGTIMQTVGGLTAAIPTNVSPTAPGTEHSTTLTTGPTAAPFLGELPHRNHPPFPPPPIMHPDLTSDQHSNYETSITGAHGSMSLQEMHDSNRRPSIFSPTTEFGAPPPTPAVYPSWQHTTTAPSNSALYAFTPQPAQPQAQTQHPSFVSQPSVPLTTQGQSYIGHAFDNLPRGTYDPTHDNLFRPGNVPPPGYAMHLDHHETRGLAAHGLKVEPNTRGHIH